MKRWIAAHILSTEDLFKEETVPMSDKEFYFSLAMICIALAMYGIIFRMLGA